MSGEVEFSKELLTSLLAFQLRKGKKQASVF